MIQLPDQLTAEAGRPHTWPAGLAALLATLLVSPFLLAGCGGPEQVPAPQSQPVRRDLAADVFARLQDALADRDAKAAAALGDDRGSPLLGDVAANAEALDVRDVSFRMIDEDPVLTATLPRGQWAAAVEATWRFDGFDRAPARAEVTMILAQEGERIRLHAIGGGARPVPLWLAGPLEVRRTADTLVLVAGPAANADRYAQLARRAVPAVEAVVGGHPRVVVEVPAGPADLDRTLGARTGDYAAIAAVTTFVGSDRADLAPVHVFVNPEVFGALKSAGAQLVMTHELTHVATDAVHSKAPQWLLEGYADHVALHGTDLPVSMTAGQIIRRVRRDGVPKALPGADEFDTRATHLGAWYEAAWRAAEVLARAGTEEQLLTFYRRASGGEPVDATLRELYGFDETELIRRWQQDLEQIAR
ncbi:hypothetical protein [Nocardioides cavernaquae]|uniref:Peptidase MA-like domain-containing protein n=1 Tax=Nocardioides cavernaquae TaxID=2321396 RepID=A0A3A5H1Z7_9ACTN|nr:hypothetical protein [Nocardioides cavernaquae]RJS44849.1 hypothetical protein D4739_00380 [Nocardioides cavernaquae]